MLVGPDKGRGVIGVRILRRAQQVVEQKAARKGGQAGAVSKRICDQSSHRSTQPDKCPSNEGHAVRSRSAVARADERVCGTLWGSAQGTRAVGVSRKEHPVRGRQLTKGGTYHEKEEGGASRAANIREVAQQGGTM